jgi:hypothetical protein
MAEVSGRVTANPSGQGVPGLIVSATATADGRNGTTSRRRLGSAVTDLAGAFRLDFEDREPAEAGRTEARTLIVSVDAPGVSDDARGAHATVLAREEREHSAGREVFRFVINEARLKAAGIERAERPTQEEIQSTDEQAQAIKRRLSEARVRRFGSTLREQLELGRESSKGFDTFLEKFSRADRSRDSRTFLPRGADIVGENLRLIRDALTDDLQKARCANAAVIDDDALHDLKERFGDLKGVPAEVLEPVIWPWKRRRPGRLHVTFPRRTLCGGPPVDDCVKVLEGEPLDDTEAPANGHGEESPTTSASSGSGNGAQPSTDGTGETGDGLSVATLVHMQTDAATPPEQPVWIPERAQVGDVQEAVKSFELESGPADAPALFDFHQLKIAFESVWLELFDPETEQTVHDLYSSLAEAGVDPNDYMDDGGALPSINLQALVKATIGAKANAASELHHWVTQAFTITSDEWDVLTADEQFDLILLAGRVLGAQWSTDGGVKDPKTGQPVDLRVDPGFGDPITLWDHKSDLLFVNSDGVSMWQRQQLRRFRRQAEQLIDNARARLEEPTAFDRLHALLKSLDQTLKQPYRFNVYAANGRHRSINFGVIVSYRQRWEPVTYQVGKLVKTVPLAPKEVRRYSRKTTVHRSRAEKEVTNNLQAHRTDSSDTWKSESEIVSKAMTKTNFQMGAQGGVNLGVGQVSGSTNLGHDAATESSEAKKEFHEAVFKAAEEYKVERTTEVNVSETTDISDEDSGEISNPNDEIPVTYLFYELQRRYRVSEEFRGITPVVMVAQEIQAINDSFLVEHSWQLRRALLDDSFRSALDYLENKLVGNEIVQRELEINLGQSRALVADLKMQFETLKDQTQTSYSALQREMQRYADAVEAQDEDGGIIPMPVGFLPSGDDGSADGARERVEAAKDAAERNAKELKDLQARLDREVTALQQTTDQYTQHLAEHLNHRAQIDALLVHVKANLFYYMQAIWDLEPPDQRFFRLQNVQVPRLHGKKTYSLEPDPDATPMPPTWKQPLKLTIHSDIDAKNIEFDALGDVADLDNLLGYKGNLMIFPMKEGNDIHDFMMSPFYNEMTQVADPDDLGNWTLHDFVEYVCCLRKTLPKRRFIERLPALTKAYEALKQAGAVDEEIIVPTDSLYIEALPGVRPVLEDFKLLHRAVDVKRARADLRGVELENIRFAARLLAGEREDPTIEKKIVVENEGETVVVPDDA